MSEAGSAWARLPPSVPRLRTCRSPISAAHSAIAAKDGRFSSGASLERVPGRERADAQCVVTELYAGEVEPSDVDESARPDDPQLHDREERLTARERLRLRVGERVERLVERRGPDVLDRGGDHAAASSRSVAAAARTESTIDWYPVQRQKLPLSARRIVASSGSSARGRGDRTPSGSSRACRSRTGARAARRTRAGSDAARRPSAKPSIVVTSRSSA